MKTKVLGLVTLALLFLPVQVHAHSGRTDSNGGHNCNVGACAGTYHYHNGGSNYTPPPPQPLITNKNIIETEVVQFQSVEQNDGELAVGQRKTTQEGVSGVKTNTYRITYTDGVQTGKDLISSVVTKDPISKIVAVGTKTDPGAVAGTSSTKTPENKETASTGEALGGLAIISGIGYGLYKLGRFGLAKAKGD